MTTVSADAERILGGLTPAQRLLAAHAALPAAVDSELVRLMRDNFLLGGRPEEQLPVTAESEAAMARLLLSPLFSPIDDDLYEMQVAARAVLLAQLQRIDGGTRLGEVAVLLERYLTERAHWPAELQWAQKISARVVTDPADVQRFLASGATQGGGHGLDGRWYAAVQARVEQQEAASATLQREVEASPAGEDAALVEVILPIFSDPDVWRRFLARFGQPDHLETDEPLPDVMASVVAHARAEGTLVDIVGAAWHGAGDNGRELLARISLRETSAVATLVDQKGSHAAAFRIVTSGLWVTAAHVVEQTSASWAIHERGHREPLYAQVLGIDTERDVAILGADGPPGLALSFADNPTPHVGDSVDVEVVSEQGLGALLNAVIAVENGRYGVQLQNDPGPRSSGAPVMDADYNVVGMMAGAAIGQRRYAVSGTVLQTALAGMLSPHQFDTRWLQPADGWFYLQLAGIALAQNDVVGYEGFHRAAADIALRHGDDELLARAGTPWPAELSRPVPPDLLEFATRFDEILTINNRTDRIARRGAQLIKLRDTASRHRGDPEWSAAVPALLGADRAAEQLVAIALLQAEPDPARLGELAAFVDAATHPPHLGYEALVALRNAAQTLPDGHLGELEAALDTVTAFLDGQDGTDRATVLRQLRRLVEERAQRRITSDWMLWRDRAELRVRFLGGSAEQQAEVSALAGEWTAGSGISFRFLPPDSAEHAEIRVAITTGQASWSYLGSEAESVPADEPTMSLDVVLPLTGRSRGNVLMEFGHALGLVSEHQQPNADLRWDRAAVARVCSAPPNNWAPEKIEQFLARYEFPTPPDYRPFDRRSVMLGEFPPELLLDGSGTRSNSAVSESDREFVRRLYPPRADAPTPLNGAQKKALIDVLRAAYPTYEDLGLMLEHEVGRTLARYAPPGRQASVVINVIKHAEAEGWIFELVTGAMRGNPGNPRLRELLRSGFLDRTTAVRRAVDDPTAAGALSSSAEAVERHRRLAAADPDAYLPQVAASLNNLSNRQADTGDLRAALTSSTEAVEHYRRLAAADPDAYLPQVAASLNNLSNRQADTGDLRAALTSSTEAVEHYRRLAAADPAAYLPNLAMSLNNLANQQADTGNHAAALTSSTEAVDIRRRLAAADPAGVQALLPGAGLLDGEQSQLERIVKSGMGFHDVETFAGVLQGQAARVCSISVNGRGPGTGFLVGPDLVLTNYHVVRDVIDGGVSPTGIECEFDYRITSQDTVEHGVRYRSADDWLVAFSPFSDTDVQADPVGIPAYDELDFALIRLAGEPGRTKDAGGHERGWIDLIAETPALSTGLPLVILQYPMASPLQMAVDTDGVLAVNANRTRVRYGANMLPGSSGSPCFTFDLRLVAMHQSAQPGRASEGIPVATIADHLRNTGHAAALGG